MPIPLNKLTLLEWPDGWTRRSPDTVSIPMPVRRSHVSREKEKAIAEAARGAGSETTKEKEQSKSDPDALATA